MNARDAFEGNPDVAVESALPGWISLTLAPEATSKQQVVEFFRSYMRDLPAELCEKLSLAIHELLGNAIEHGCHFDRGRGVRFSFIRTQRMILVHIQDAGGGFSIEDVPHAALNNPPDDPLKHAEYRSQQGMRPGGFGILLVKEIADELVYNELGNEVLLVKYLNQDCNCR